MENISVNIGERKIPLKFRMPEFIQIEEEVGNLGEVRDLILNGKNRLRHIITIIRIMGNAGLKRDGEEADLTDEWLCENMEPHSLTAYQVAIIAALSKGGKSEAVKEENEKTERDLVLEEIEAKKDPVNSHTGE